MDLYTSPEEGAGAATLTLLRGLHVCLALWTLLYPYLLPTPVSRVASTSAAVNGPVLAIAMLLAAGAWAVRRRMVLPLLQRLSDDADNDVLLRQYRKRDVFTMTLTQAAALMGYTLATMGASDRWYALPIGLGIVLPMVWWPRLERLSAVI